MRMKRFLGVALACTMLLSVPIKAEEMTAVGNYTAEESENVLDIDSLDKQEPTYLDKGEVQELLDEQDIPQPYVTTPDACEPNDTISTAYPYDRVPITTPALTSKTDLFWLGMRTAGLHSEEDEDWYYVNLTAGETYFVDIRNVGLRNWYIELYYFNADGTGYYYTTDPEENSVYEKKPEKYFYFEAEDTGRYYIKINNGGDWANKLNYYFYVGPAIQTFDIVNMPTYDGVQFLGNTYKTYVCNLKGIVPAETAIVNLSLTDNITSGDKCTEIEKYMMAGGKTYYNASGGTSDVIRNINGVSLGQVWRIGARCAKNLHLTNWSGVLNGRFVCIMEPFPGNELSF